MEKKIGFKELHWFLKILVVYGTLSLVLNLLIFGTGFTLALLGYS